MKCVSINSLLSLSILLAIVCGVKSEYFDLDGSSCSLNVCSNLGEPCDQNNILSGSQCYIQDRCYNGVCVESLPDGSICKNTSDCQLGFSCLPIDINNSSNSNIQYNSNNNYNIKIKNKNSNNNSGDSNSIKVCQKSFYVEYGGTCNKTFDCLNGLECIGSKCLTPSIGCLSDVQCDRDSICDENGICKKVVLKENECFIYRTLSCKNGFLPCSLTSFNKSSIGVCRDSIEEGNPCLVNKYSCDWNVGQYCKPIKAGSIYGRCTKTPSNSLNPCKTINQCKEYEFCKCDPKSGVGYCLSRGTYIGTYCRESARIFMECFAKTNCTEPFSSNPFGCVYQYCKEEASCMSLYCTERMLPVNPCVNTRCNLSIFKSKDKDLKFLSQSNQNKLNHIIIINLLFIVLIII